jgi:hypothetical protein
VVTEKVIINGKEVVNKKNVIKDGKEISNEEYYAPEQQLEYKTEQPPPIKKIKQETINLPDKPAKKTKKYIPLDPESGDSE